MWVKCSKCKFGGNGDNTCKYGNNIERCADSIGCLTTGIPITK